MSSRDLLEDAGLRAGWTINTMLDVICDYVDNQDSDAALEDYLSVRMGEEETMGRDDLCEKCRVKDHDQCPLVEDSCSCCDDTKERM